MIKAEVYYHEPNDCIVIVSEVYSKHEYQIEGCEFSEFKLTGIAIDNGDLIFLAGEQAVSKFVYLGDL